MLAQSNSKLLRKVGCRVARPRAGHSAGRAPPPPLGSSQGAPYCTELWPLEISAIHALVAFTSGLRGAAGFSYRLSTAVRRGMVFKGCENPLTQNISRKLEGPASSCGEGAYSKAHVVAREHLWLLFTRNFLSVLGILPQF